MHTSVRGEQKWWSFSRMCYRHTHTHTHTHTRTHAHTQCHIIYLLSLSLSLSHSLSLTHTHSSWPAEVVQCLEDILDIQAQLVYDHLPPEAQAKWMALSYVALPGGRGGGGGSLEAGHATRFLDASCVSTPLMMRKVLQTCTNCHHASIIRASPIVCVLPGRRTKSRW